MRRKHALRVCCAWRVGEVQGSAYLDTFICAVLGLVRLQVLAWQGRLYTHTVAVRHLARPRAMGRGATQKAGMKRK